MRPESAVPQAPSHDEIARRAYELFVNKGCVQGQDRQDWFQAECELRGSTADAPCAKPEAVPASLRSESQDAAKDSAGTMPSVNCRKGRNRGGLNQV